MDDLFARLQSAMDDVEAAPEGGLDPAALLELPHDVRRLLQAIARRVDATAAELAADLDLDAAAVTTLLETLVAKGLVASRGADAGYRVAFGPRPTRPLPLDLWALLDDRTHG